MAGGTGLKSVFDQIVHTTIRLEVTTTSRSTFFATGFFSNFSRKIGEDFGSEISAQAIVTNRHVLEDAHEITLRFTRATEDGSPDVGQIVATTINDIAAVRHFHPNPEVDLAALYIAGALHELETRGDEPHFINVADTSWITRSEIEGLVAVEQVLMVGYPDSLWDRVNNFPIVRTGISATPPYADFEGRSDFMIDCACFPGSSGSPVFLASTSGYATKEGTITLGGRLKLLGILHSGPIAIVEGQISRLEPPRLSDLVPPSNALMGLGICVKAYELESFVEGLGQPK